MRDSLRGNLLLRRATLLAFVAAFECKTITRCALRFMCARMSQARGNSNVTNHIPQCEKRDARMRDGPCCLRRGNAVVFIFPRAMRGRGAPTGAVVGSAPRDELAKPDAWHSARFGEEARRLSALHVRSFFEPGHAFGKLSPARQPAPGRAIAPEWSPEFARDRGRQAATARTAPPAEPQARGDGPRLRSFRSRSERRPDQWPFPPRLAPSNDVTG